MGEFELLAKLRERLPPAGPRVAARQRRRRRGHRPRRRHRDLGRRDRRGRPLPPRRGDAWRQIGRKALATALSDLAAMGAEAGEAYVVLGAPADLGEDELLELLDGIARARRARPARPWPAATSPGRRSLTLAVTVVGHARGAGAAASAAAAPSPGDLLVLTGEIGGAAAGRLLLDDPEPGGRGRRRRPPSGCAPRQLDPAPAPALPGGPWPRPAPRAMIDLSDGLGGDAGHLAERQRRRACGSTPRTLPLADGRRRGRRGGRPRPARAGRLGRRGLRAAGGAAAGAAGRGDRRGSARRRRRR